MTSREDSNKEDVAKQSSASWPAVSWKEIRDHLVGRLMMDEEWIVDTPNQLVWWPSPLPVSVRVVEQGSFPGSTENWIQVSASTRIAVVEEELGRELACDLNNRFRVGALVYLEDSLHLITNYAFNPRNRSLLAWFHQAILIQASTALDLVGEVSHIKGVEIPSIQHPTSGERFDVDELVDIYGTEQLNFDVDEGVEEQFELIRSQIAEFFLGNGYQLGFSNDEVDFFNLGFDSDDPDALLDGAFDCAVGFMRGTILERKLGPSLLIKARVLPLGVYFMEDEVTRANEALCKFVGTSLFGYVSGPEMEDDGSCLWSVVPHLTLAEWSKLGPRAFRDSVVNAIVHVTAAAKTLRRDFVGIDWP